MCKIRDFKRDFLLKKKQPNRKQKISPYCPSKVLILRFSIFDFFLSFFVRCARKGPQAARKARANKMDVCPQCRPKRSGKLSKGYSLKRSPLQSRVNRWRYGASLANFYNHHSLYELSTYAVYHIFRNNTPL